MTLWENIMIRVCMLVLLLTGCAVYSGPVADGISTEIALQSGATEANPLLFGGHPAALVLSVAARSAYMESRREQRNCVNQTAWVSGAGWGYTANNLLAASAIAPMITLPVGIATGVVYAYATEDARRDWCYPVYPACSLADLPDGARAAECVKGKLVVTAW